MLLAVLQARVELGLGTVGVGFFGLLAAWSRFIGIVLEKISKLGKRYLGQMREKMAHLRQLPDTIMPGDAGREGDLSLAVGIFGYEVLKGTPYAEAFPSSGWFEEDPKKKGRGWFEKDPEKKEEEDQGQKV